MNPDDLIPSYKPVGPKGLEPNSGLIQQMFEADLVVASIEGNTVIVKDRYNDPNKNEVVRAVCRLLSRYVFGDKFKMFVPVFEEDMKKAIDGVMDNHHIGFRR